VRHRGRERQNERYGKEEGDRGKKRKRERE
jgi:hypothetical protein